LGAVFNKNLVNTAPNSYPSHLLQFFRRKATSDFLASLYRCPLRFCGATAF